AVALAVVLGVAGDPAAAGLAGADADDGVAATGQTTTVRVEAQEMRFVPDVVEAPAGDRLVIELVNTDDDVHDLVLDNGARSGRLSAGESVEVDLGVVGRDVEGWCSVAGHRQMGMTLDVVAVGAAPQAADDDGEGTASPSAHHHHGGSGDGDSGSGDMARDHLDLMAEPDEAFTAHPAELPPAPG